ncbi:(d)CMP kinase [Ectothiorhodospiraceae bacterium WFHF3C12]|nr:(d)CMP kinase [Ectothiorhodospiraceae bacterium WFHF3C12]
MGGGGVETDRAAVPTVTIDGPSGSGKGTVARLIARRLDWHLLDSGAIYRLLGLAALRQGADLADEAVLVDLARDLNVAFPARVQDDQQVLLDGEAVGQLIRTEDVGNAASKVAALPAVREALLQRQRDFRKPPGLVADGRDMGTVVFPDAGLKIFLTASVEERAHRRYNQLKDQGLGGTLSDLLREIAERDERDANRAVAPLVPAPDSVTVDTTGLSVEAVMAELMEHIAGRFDLQQ